MSAGGCFYTSMGEDGVPHLNLDTPRTNAVLNALLAMPCDRSVTCGGRCGRNFVKFFFFKHLYLHFLYVIMS